MAIVNDNGGMYMPVAPAYGGGGGFGGFGDNGWWIILLLLCGWGGMGMGGFGGWGGMGNMALGYDFPWILNGQRNITGDMNNGFQNAQLNDAVTSVRDGISSLSTQMCGGFGDVSTQLCNGFNGVTGAVNNAQNAIAQQLYTGQLADLERSFAAQTANSQGMNALQAQLAQCCCDNRAATADLKYTVATEACANRTAAAQNTQNVVDAVRGGNQAILDKLCQLELDNYKREADNLRSQLNMAALRESQTAQTAQILAGQNAEVDALYTRLSNCPVPSTPVYGRIPIFQCNGGNGGCGCAA